MKEQTMGVLLPNDRFNIQSGLNSHRKIADS